MDDGSKAATEQGPTRSFLVVRGADVTGYKTPTSYCETLVHCIKGLIGTGIFALGWAFLHSGMLLGPILMTIIALVNLHCQHILVRACVKITDKESVAVLPTFAETVQYTFEDSSVPWLQKHSRRFGLMTDTFLILGEYGGCTVYISFVANHFGEIAEAHGWKQGYRVMLAIVLIPMWLTTFLGNLKLLVPLSLTANLLIWVGIVLVLYYSCKELPPINERDLIAHVEKLPMFLGVVLFAFGGIAFVIPLRMEMAKPELATTACGILNVSMAVSTALYGTVGIFSYWRWGEDIKGSAFLNLPEQEVLSQATKILISIAVMLSYTLHMYVIFEIVYPKFYKKCGPFKHPEFMRMIYKSAAVLTTYCLANLTPDLAVYISLVGALALCALCILFPAMLDLVLLYDQLTYFVIIRDVIYIITAIVGGVAGVVLSILDIINLYTE